MSTASRVEAETPGLPFSTRLTVASLTPTLRATSASLLDMTAMLRQVAQELDSRERDGAPAVKALSGHSRRSGRSEA